MEKKKNSLRSSCSASCCSSHHIFTYLITEIQSQYGFISISALSYELEDTRFLYASKIAYLGLDPLTSSQNMRLISEYKIKSESPRVYDEETFYKLRKFKNKVYAEEYD